MLPAAPGSTGKRSRGRSSAKGAFTSKRTRDCRGIPGQREVGAERAAERLDALPVGVLDYRIGSGRAAGHAHDQPDDQAVDDAVAPVSYTHLTLPTSDLV